MKKLAVVISAVVQVSIVLYAAQGRAQADQLSPLPKDVVYEQNLQSQAKLPDWVDSFFDARKFNKINLPGLAVSTEPTDWLHRIFFSKNLKKQVMVKAGVEVKGSVHWGQLYPLIDGAYAVHIRQDNQAIVYFLKGFSLQEAREMAADLQTKQFKTTSLFQIERQVAEDKISKSVFLNLMSPSNAWAEDNKNKAVCDASPTAPASMSASESEFLQSSWECLKGVVGGAWDATGGVVQTAYKVVRHPIETYRSVQHQFDRFATFVSDFSNKMGELKTAIFSLPTPVKAKLICELGASVGTSVLVSFVTAGTGAPMVLKNLANVLNKLALTEKLQALGPLALKISARAEKLEDAYNIVNPKTLKKTEAELRKAQEAFEKAQNKLAVARKKFHQYENEALAAEEPEIKKALDEMLDAQTELGRWQSYFLYKESADALKVSNKELTTLRQKLSDLEFRYKKLDELPKPKSMADSFSPDFGEMEKVTNMSAQTYNEMMNAQKQLIDKAIKLTSAIRNRSYAMQMATPLEKQIYIDAQRRAIIESGILNGMMTCERLRDLDEALVREYDSKPSPSTDGGSKSQSGKQ